MSEIAATYATRRSPRMSADERREAIVAAGVDEFAAKGLAGASTDAIARRAGVSQPYVFQLFGTKKDLFLAVVRRCFERTRITFEDAAARYDRGEDRSSATVRSARWARPTSGCSPIERCSWSSSRPTRPAATRTSRHRGPRRVRRPPPVRGSDSGATAHEIHQFFAEGMLLNVGAAVQLEGEPMTWTLDEAGRWRLTGSPPPTPFSLA